MTNRKQKKDKQIPECFNNRYFRIVKAWMTLFCPLFFAIYFQFISVLRQFESQIIVRNIFHIMTQDIPAFIQ